MSLSLRCRFILAPLLALLLIPAAGLRADSLRLQSGEEVRGEIRKESVQGVVLASGGSAKTYARAQLSADGITYDNMPPQLRDAREALDGRDFERAHRGFRAVIQLSEAAPGAAPGGAADAKAAGKNGKKAAGKTPPRAGAGGAGTAIVRPIFLQHALQGEAQTFQAEGKDAEALAAIDELLNKVPDTWYLLDALLNKVRVATRSGEAAAITAAVEDAKSRAAKAGAGAEISDRIEIVRAENQMRQGKAAEAQKIYKGLERSPVKPVADAAKLGLAQLALAGGDLVQAKIAFNGLLRDSKERSVLCAAAGGLGQAQMKEMVATNKSVEGLREALESYLRAAVLYFPGEGDPTEPHQAALLNAAECAEELVNLQKKEKKDQKAVDGFRTVARDLYQELRATYPGSPGAAKAAEALRRLSGTAQ